MQFRPLALASLTLVLVACGGSDSGSSTNNTSTPTPTPTPTPTTTVSGSVVKGPVTGAAINVRAASDGRLLATTTTGAGGTYTVNVAYVGDVIVEASGGSYVDEATGATLPLGTTMRVVVPATGSAVTGVITPLTTLAYSNAFPSPGSTVSAAAFQQATSQVAAQFQMPQVNLIVGQPVLGANADAYGRVLTGISRYLQQNNATLQSLVTQTLGSAEWSQVMLKFNTAYHSVYPNSPITFSANGSTINVGGTGAGGGSGTCGVNVQGTIGVNGIILPLNLNYCVTGIAAGSCTSGNSALSQALATQQGVVGAANLNYSYSAACAGGAITINLQ